MRTVSLKDIMFNQKLLEIAKEKGGFPQSLIDDFEEMLADSKRKYRLGLRMENERFESFRGTNGKVVNCGGEWDSYWIKVFFEGENWSKEDKEEFSRHIWIHCKPSQYDCTGQTFTWAVDCFNVPRGVVCYVREALDV